MEPKVLILDEATAFLDPSAEERLKKTVRSLMEGKTIVVISHRLSAIQGADKIITLEGSGLVEDRAVAASSSRMGTGTSEDEEVVEQDIL
jgi:ABC-type multidrug transport system fused ATPase/permease subunit